MLGLCLYVVLADPAAVGEVRDARSWAPSEARFQELFSDLRMVYPNSLGEEVAGEHWKVLEFAACIWVSIVACNV